MAQSEVRGPKDLVHQIIQVGVVVPDIQEPIEGMRRVFGVEPDFVREVRYPEICFRGETKSDAWAKIASYGCFGVKIEFMQPMGEGSSMWREFADNNTSRYALHHIKFNDVQDNDEMTRALAQRGVAVELEGKSVVNPDGRFTFYDTVDQVGFISEVSTAPKQQD